MRKLDGCDSFLRLYTFILKSGVFVTPLACFVLVAHASSGPAPEPLTGAYEEAKAMNRQYLDAKEKGEIFDIKRILGIYTADHCSLQFNQDKSQAVFHYKSPWEFSSRAPKVRFRIFMIDSDLVRIIEQDVDDNGNVKEPDDIYQVIQPFSVRTKKYSVQDKLSCSMTKYKFRATLNSLESDTHWFSNADEC